MNTSTVIITGATRGLGEALTDALMRRTAHQVISLSRRTTAQQEAYDKSRFSLIPVDFTQEDDYRHISRLNGLVRHPELVLISNAAMLGPVGPAGSFTAEAIDRVLAVNFRAAVYLANYLLKNFTRHRLTMLNISSGAAIRPISHWSLYCATKAGMAMFFDVLQQEHPHARFINFEPGVMDTAMQQQIRSSDFPLREKFIGYQEKGMLRQPAEVAEELVNDYLL